jgi:hypothetical protein
VPGAKHDAARRQPVDFEFMYRRAMGVAVYQKPHAAATHRGHYRR